MSLKMVCRECNVEINYNVFDNTFVCPKCKVIYSMSCKDCGSKKFQNIYPINKE